MNTVKGKGQCQNYNYNAQGDEPAFGQLHLVYRLLISFLKSILSMIVFVFVSFLYFCIMFANPITVS